MSISRILSLGLALGAISCPVIHAAEGATTDKSATPVEAAEPAEPAKPSTTEPASAMSLTEEGGYLLGIQLAMQVKQHIQQAKGDLGELDEAKIFEGITDVFEGNKFKVEPRVRWEKLLANCVRRQLKQMVLCLMSRKKLVKIISQSLRVKLA
ncbi:MAG: hypothetical protein HRU15_19950 [Planctomycetes bacterium]|nr:hypothetical protein [Planctomycetota bacterium]